MASEGAPADGLPITPSPTKLQRSTDLTRDQRIEIRALRKYMKLSYEEIAAKTPFSYRQIQRACQGPVTPQKHKRTPRKSQDSDTSGESA